MTGSLTDRVAANVVGLTFEELPEDVVELAQQCLLDWVAVTVAGSREPVARAILATVEQSIDPTRGASIVGHAGYLPPMLAALVNGTAAHAIDSSGRIEAPSTRSKG